MPGSFTGRVPPFPVSLLHWKATTRWSWGLLSPLEGKGQAGERRGTKQPGRGPLEEPPSAPPFAAGPSSAPLLALQLRPRGSCSSQTGCRVLHGAGAGAAHPGEPVPCDLVPGGPPPGTSGSLGRETKGPLPLERNLCFSVKGKNLHCCNLFLIVP